MQLHIYKDGEALSQAVAKWITDSIRDTLKKQPRFTIALSGGSTPKRLHELLSNAPYKDQIDWTRLHVFWGDERAVPFEDARNNAKMAYDTLLNFVPVPASQIHVMRTDLSPEQSAAEYEKLLRVYFPAGPVATTMASSLAAGDTTPFPAGNTGTAGGVTSFDLVLLGMGDDGHTLSLFPGTKVVHEEQAWVKAFFLEAQDMYRITLTKTIVNRASRVAFLTTGTGKAHALKEVLKGRYDPDKYPSQEIRPMGELHWFVDEAAAAGLD
jgi:6-phosphogluconolactonase